MSKTPTEGMPQVGGEPEGKTRPPLTGDTQQILRFSWRNTGMGGYTKSIVLCLDCRKVLEAVDKYRSRRGTHGEDTYVHPRNHNVQHFTLFRSNSGRRDLCHTNGLPSSLVDYLVYTWLTCGEFPQPEKIAKVMGW